MFQTIGRYLRTTQESGKYYLHVRSVERGTFFGTMSLDEPIDLLMFFVKYIWDGSIGDTIWRVYRFTRRLGANWTVQ